MLIIKFKKIMSSSYFMLITCGKVVDIGWDKKWINYLAIKEKRIFQRPI